MTIDDLIIQAYKYAEKVDDSYDQNAVCLFSPNLEGQIVWATPYSTIVNDIYVDFNELRNLTAACCRSGIITTGKTILTISLPLNEDIAFFDLLQVKQVVLHLPRVYHREVTRRVNNLKDALQKLGINFVLITTEIGYKTKISKEGASYVVE
jgi:hypothetical protein